MRRPSGSQVAVMPPDVWYRGGMEKTTVYLPDELKRALRRAARSTGRSEADLIREGSGW